MSNHCPDCLKFVSLETDEPETNNIEIDQSTGEVSLEVHMQRTCVECGFIMKETTFNASVDGSLISGETGEIPDHIASHTEAGEDYSLDVNEDSIESVEERKTTDRNGKPIKMIRFMKTMVGFHIEFTVECSCGATFSGDHTETEQASAWDDLNY